VRKRIERLEALEQAAVRAELRAMSDAEREEELARLLSVEERQWLRSLSAAELAALSAAGPDALEAAWMKGPTTGVKPSRRSRRASE
jgi:hypothetical protein